MTTKIDWCDEVWNPVTGCSKISPGCDHCYASRMALRLAGRCGYPKMNPFQVTLHQDNLAKPKAWKKPRRIFVNSMGDLFHNDVRDEWIMAVMKTIEACPQHTFLILTKRINRAVEFFGGLSGAGLTAPAIPNLWMGATVESADYLWRIGQLMLIPAAKHFISIEPALGPVDITLYLPQIERVVRGVTVPRSIDYYVPGLDWVIMGGETGPGARPMHPEWVRSIRDQCKATGTPFFFKGWGAWCEVSFENGKRGRIYGPSRACVSEGGEWWESSNRFIDQICYPNESEGVIMKRFRDKAEKVAYGRKIDGKEWRETPR
jgi:protein gp37